MERPSEAERSAAENSVRPDTARTASNATGAGDQDAAWRGELAQRLQAYRARRRRVQNEAQSEFTFERNDAEPPMDASVAVEETPPTAPEEDFAFTIAIGRNAAKRDDSRMLIDVSAPPEEEQATAFGPAVELSSAPEASSPAASIEERRIAGLIDAGCLLFAYGAFLTLFGSLGGQFTFSKLSAAVCVATFAFVYLQYFGLFTVFGGTTPGMMLRGLQVVSLDGEEPTPRQMLLRSLGYILSAGTFFMGFAWALWDEDGLAWHDRLSRTCLSPAATLAEADAPHAAHSR